LKEGDAAAQQLRVQGHNQGAHPHYHKNLQKNANENEIKKICFWVSDLDLDPHWIRIFGVLESESAF